MYAQFTRLKDPTSRRDAARLGKQDRQRLPRVSAYCTAASYKLDDLMKYLKGKSKLREAAPKLFDECIYTPYRYGKTEQDKPGQKHVAESSGSQTQRHGRRFSDSAIEVETHNEERRDNLIDLHNGQESHGYGESSTTDEPVADTRRLSDQMDSIDSLDFDTTVHIPEVFLFDYGTVVIWGMTLQQEQRFLREITKFEVDKLAKDDVQTEEFNFYYTREYQARIYNDFISLREKRNYMTKLAISHALSQSVKVIMHSFIAIINSNSSSRRHFMRISWTRQ